jgi:hypothetical protein
LMVIAWLLLALSHITFVFSALIFKPV